MDLKGKEVLIFAVNYIYSGVLETLSHDVVELSEPHIVYETGEFTAKRWKDVQRLPMDRLRIERSAVESMGAVVRK